MQIAIERFLIAIGICALAFVAALRIDSAIGEQGAREDLATRFTVGPPHAMPPDTTDWSEARRVAWQASQRTGSGAPLGVLSIASIGLLKSALFSSAKFATEYSSMSMTARLM